MNIKDPRVHDLARRLAERRGTTLTAAVHHALEEALARSGPLPRRDLRRRCAALPVLDDRHPDDIVGYDEHGLPR